MCKLGIRSEAIITAGSVIGQLPLGRIVER